MNRRSLPALAFAAVAALAVGLSACITVFPEAEPAALYRFEGNVAGQQPTNRTGSVSVMRAPVALPKAAAGDRILTATGGSVAYIAGARWISPASTLFDEAVARAFDATNGPARFTPRGELGRPDYALRIEVLSFETRYLNGAGTAPTVFIRLGATVQRVQDRSIAGRQMFEVSQPAADNRVTAIVEAYDQATSKILTEVTGWTGNVVR